MDERTMPKDQPGRFRKSNLERAREQLRDQIVADVLRMGKESDLNYFDAVAVFEMAKEKLNEIRRASA